MKTLYKLDGTIATNDLLQLSDFDLQLIWSGDYAGGSVLYVNASLDNFKSLYFIGNGVSAYCLNVPILPMAFRTQQQSNYGLASFIVGTYNYLDKALYIEKDCIVQVGQHVGKIYGVK